MRTLLSIATAGLVVTALAAPAAQPDEVLVSVDAFMRGMVISCPRGGQIWGSPLMAESLGALEDLAPPL